MSQTEGSNPLVYASSDAKKVKYEMMLLEPAAFERIRLKNHRSE